MCLDLYGLHQTRRTASQGLYPNSPDVVAMKDGHAGWPSVCLPRHVGHLVTVWLWAVEGLKPG